MALDFTTGMAAVSGADYAAAIEPNFAFGVWLYPDTLPDSHVLSLYDSANPTTDFEKFKIGSGNLIWEFNDGTATGSIVHTGITSATWYQVTGVCKANNDRVLWVNGTVIGTATTAVSPILNRAILGLFGASTDFDGKISDPMVWDLSSDITSVELQAIAAGFTPLSIRAPEAHSYWQLYGTGPWPNVVRPESETTDLITSGTTPVEATVSPPIAWPALPEYSPPYWDAVTTATGVGTVGGSEYMDMFPTGAWTGVSSLSLVAEASYFPTLSWTGVATMFWDTTSNTTYQGVLAMTGVGSMSWTFQLVMYSTLSMTPEATFSGFTTMDWRPSWTMTGYAGLNLPSNHFRPMTSNPAVSGASVPITNQARFLFTVAGTPVDLTNPYYNLLDMDFNYDKKTVQFSEIASPYIGRPTWRPEQNVKVEIDFDDGDGLLTYFTGQIVRRTHTGVNHEEEISYQAEGIQTLANRVTMLNTTGKPEITFTVGTTVITIIGSTEVTTTYAKTIKSAIFDLFTIMSSPLSANSISTALDTLTLNQIGGDLPETVQITNQGFYAGVAQIMGYEYGKRCFWDDVQQRWAFPNIVEAVQITTQIESSQLESCIYDVSTEGRFTAIRLMAEDENALDDNIRTKTETLTTERGTFNVSRVEVTLQPDWETILEGTWNYYKVEALNPATLEADWFWVYRRWKMPEATIDEWPGTPVKIYQKVLSVQDDPASERWERLAASVSFKRKEVIAHQPAIQRWSNPWVEPQGGGRMVAGPIEVKMAYYPRQYISGTVITSISTAGTPTIVTTQFDSAFLLGNIRYPVNGYEGTAYTMFDVQRELVELVSYTEVTTENARARLALYKDVLISGEMPFAGDPIKSFMNLQARMRVAHATNQTGISTIDAIITGYRYSFGRPGRNSVQLSTDKSGLVRI